MNKKLESLEQEKKREILESLEIQKMLDEYKYTYKYRYH